MPDVDAAMRVAAGVVGGVEDGQGLAFWVCVGRVTGSIWGCAGVLRDGAERLLSTRAEER